MKKKVVESVEFEPAPPGLPVLHSLSVPTNLLRIIRLSYVLKTRTNIDSFMYTVVVLFSRNNILKTRTYLSSFRLQQGLEIRGFWFQKKTVQLKTALREVYTYVLKKPVQLQGFSVSRGYCYVVACTV